MIRCLGESFQEDSAWAYGRLMSAWCAAAAQRSERTCSRTAQGFRLSKRRRSARSSACTAATLGSGARVLAGCSHQGCYTRWRSKPVLAALLRLQDASDM